jgi:SAM-dependent methyltransferase
MSAAATAAALDRATRGPQTWTYEDIRGAILSVHDPRLVPAATPYAVLEAGGGSDCHLPLPAHAQITTIDIDPAALTMNTYAHEKLCGDLETFEYGARQFDLIIVWDVLEHLTRPDAALARLTSALKPGGRLVVVGPVTNTLKGLVTRWTPHAVHVFFYKHVLAVEQAGQPGWPPFRVAHAAGASADAVLAQIERFGLVVEAAQGFESSHVQALAAKSRIALYAYRAAEWALATVTFGRFERGMTDFFVVARR